MFKLVLKCRVLLTFAFSLLISAIYLPAQHRKQLDLRPPETLAGIQNRFLLLKYNNKNSGLNTGYSQGNCI